MPYDWNEIVARIRTRIASPGSVMWPDVRNSIQRLCEGRKFASPEDAQHSTISHLELQRLLADQGSVLKNAYPEKGGLNITVRGINVDGDVLIVTAHLPDDEHSPLEIRGFTFEQR